MGAPARGDPRADDAVRPSPRPVPRAGGRLAPVVAHIEAHADRPLRPTDLARVGCMSVRTLHASFQQSFGVSPMAYVRRVRLERVRAELTGSRDVRITDLAMRWGFFHPSRFAQQYRDRYGELPSETVRRSS